RALVPRGAQDKCGLEEIAVSAGGARSDERLVERDALARDLVRRERVAGTERLRDQRHHRGEVEDLVDLVARVRTGGEARVREIGEPLLAIPGIGEIVG